jgi:hypothetical protein
VVERGEQGEFLTVKTGTEVFRPFVPNPLPPQPPLVLDTVLQDLLEEANRALGRLDGVTLLLPDTSLLLYFYVRKEAVLSSPGGGHRAAG